MCASLFFKVFSSVFVIEKNLIKSIVKHFAEFSADFLTFWYKILYGRFLDQLVTKNEILLEMNNANNYSQWLTCANELDNLEGQNIWRLQDYSPDYDCDLIARRLEEMHSAYSWADINALAFLLRTSMSRNMGNIGHKGLYKNSRVGTKVLIENYLHQLAALVDYMVLQPSYFENICLYQIDSRPHHGLLRLPTPASIAAAMTLSRDLGKKDFEFSSKKTEIIMKQLSFFSELRHALGNSALMLSGGATLGIHHIGVLKCLYEQKMLPRILSGSSAGAIVAAMVAVRLDPEIHEILSSLDDVSWHFFEKPQHSVLDATFSFTRIARQFIRLLRDGAVFDSDVLSEFLRDHIGPNVTFLEAYNRTRRVLNVAVSSTTSYEMPRLLNYLTAPDVLIWTAVAASCAAPTLFKSSKILIKSATGEIYPWSGSDDATWMDGSVENDLPISRIAHLFNVNFFIVSQVNPHIVPFLIKGVRESDFDSFKKTIFHVIREEILFRLPMLMDLGLVPQKLGLFLRNVLSQQYEGDVTIVPYTVALTDLFNIFTVPTSERVQSSVLRGERATWPFIAYIQSQTFIEMKLDRVLYSLKCKLLEQSWMGISKNIPNSTFPSSSAENDNSGHRSDSSKHLINEQKYSSDCLPDRIESLSWHKEAATPPLLSELKWRPALKDVIGRVRSYYPESR